MTVRNRGDSLIWRMLRPVDVEIPAWIDSVRILQKLRIELDKSLIQSEQRLSRLPANGR
jgi:hypothetical protein